MVIRSGWLHSKTSPRAEVPRAGRGAKSDHPADIHEFHQECAKPFLDRELLSSSQVLRASLMAQLPANVAAAGSIHGSGRSPREGNGNPLQDSCLRNPTDRGAWRATVHGVAKSWTRLSDWATTSSQVLGLRTIVHCLKGLMQMSQKDFCKMH